MRIIYPFVSPKSIQKNHLLFLITVLFLVTIANPAQAQFTGLVTNNNNSGLGSLREAINFVNTFGGDITFNLGGSGPWVINISSSLPPITRNGTRVRGNSQSGYNFNSGNIITIDGPGASSGVRGLELNRDGIEVRGLRFRNFDLGIINFEDFVTIRDCVFSGNNRGIENQGRNLAVENSYFGIGPTNIVENQNTNGIINFGGDFLEVVNSVFGNNDRSIQSQDCDAPNIESCKFGTDISGNNPVGSNDLHIFLIRGSAGSIDNCVIANSSGNGILLQDFDNLTIQDNFIGTNPSGNLALPNNNGISFQSPASDQIDIVLNTIAYNNNRGINFGGSGSFGVFIVDNQIYCNNSGGIRLNGGNLGKGPPTINDANPLYISGTGNEGDRIQIFKNEECDRQQGEIILGTVFVSGGTWRLEQSQFASTLAVGDRITATATNGSKNSSEFTAARSIVDPLTVTNTNDAGEGSLRWAITNANSIAASSTLVFNLPGSGPWEINLQSPLPAISRALIMDARTQANWNWDQNRTLVINGAAISSGSATLIINAANTSVYGFEFLNFNQDAFSGGVDINASSVRIEQNVFSSCNRAIELFSTANNAIIRNNRIGTTADGLSPALPSQLGIAAFSTDGLTLDNNLIVNSSSAAILVDNVTNSSIIDNNLGITLDGTISANQDGIFIQNASALASDNVLIQGNTLAHSNTFGIHFSSSTAGNRIRMKENAIFCNGTRGIETAGASANQNDGLVQVAATNFIQGTGTNGDTVEVYVNRSCNRDQGEVFLGWTTVNGGSWILNQASFLTTIAVGDVITMTLSDNLGNTSEFSAPVTVAPPYTVSNTNDSGIGSLRQAITNANVVAGTQSLVFNLTGSGPWQINLQSPLPDITESILIDARTETNWNWDLNQTLILNGLSLTGSTIHGLSVDADNSAIYGLEFINFNADQFSSGLYITASNVTAEQNVFRGNNEGIQVSGAFSNIRIVNNRIGTRADGFSTANPNTIGVFLFGGNNHLVQNNLISNSPFAGLLIDNIVDSQILDNTIGLDLNGNPLPNQYGIDVQDGVGLPSERILIQNNTIAYNSADGIWFFSNDAGNQVTISQNSIFCNDNQGIETQGAANYQNPGQIQLATLSFIRGTGVNGETIEVFVNSSCNQDQGEIYLGSATVSGGVWQLNQANYQTTLALGNMVTMTSTDAQGNTSEFSTGEMVVEPFTISNTNDAGAGSLRKAIENANLVSGRQSLVFNLPGSGPWQVNLQSPLPAITDTITIDARTQANWNWDLNRTFILNGLSLTGTVTVQGLSVDAFGSDIHGIEFINFNADQFSSGLKIGASSLTATQNIFRGNSDGIQATASYTNISINNNRFGTRADGVTNANPNRNGIVIFQGNNYTIQNNLIANSTIAGISIDNLLDSQIQNNNIGLDLNSNALPNQYGIELQNSAGLPSERINIINNTIAYNSADGIQFSTTNAGDQVLISQNRIFCNSSRGFQSQGSANFQNPGQIRAASQSFIRGSGVNGETIEVFVNPSCNQDQGEIFLGSTTVSGGFWQLDQSAFQTSLALGNVVTMTSTDSQGNTSEFSNAETVNNLFTVTNTNDSGAGSLRKVISNANAVPGTENITFALPGVGPWTIILASELPDITDPIILDARTQSGWDWNTGNTLILNGSGLSGGGVGLDIQADNCQIYGLEFLNFNSSASSAGILLNANLARIEQNVFQGNSLGINSGLGFNDLNLRNNRCGTQADGQGAGLANTAGIQIFGGSNHLLENNILSGNTSSGLILDGINNSIIRNNLIGLDQTGTALPNRFGISFTFTQSATASDVSILNNQIAYNSDYGLRFTSSNAGLRVSLSQNIIYCNGLSGLLFNGSNGGLNAPQINNAIFTEIQGTGVNGQTIEVYVDTLCNQDQGLLFLGSLTVSGTTWSLNETNFAFALRTGYRVTAIARDSQGNTSEFSAPLVVQDPFTVTNTNDSGQGSLRWAIDNARSAGGGDITFALSGDGPWTIQPNSLLPNLDVPISINALSQSGADSLNPIILRTNNLPSAFRVRSQDCLIQGFEISGFTTGIDVTARNAQIIQNTITGSENAIFLNVASDNLVQSNRLGVNGSTNTAVPNQRGVLLEGGQNNQIVGNIISGNSLEGVVIRGNAQANRVAQNKIGTDGTGTVAIPNRDGVIISGTASLNVIGSENSNEGNLISGNTGDAILLGLSTRNNRVYGNLIGIQQPAADQSNFLSLPNGNLGINILGADNSIGGDASFPPNLIAFNLSSGIEINGSNAQRNNIGNNQIFCNETGGIRLISGGNSNKNPPTISGLQPFFIQGTSNGSDRIDIYGNLLCSQNQGETYLGSTTADSDGNWVFETQVIDLFYTATATDTLGNTSAYSTVASLGAPFAPNNLVARAISPTEIELNWQDNAPNENGFRLWRSVNDTLNFTLLTQAVLGPDTSNYVDEVATNVRYFYRIQAFNNLGNSTFSNISSDSTNENVLPAPSNLVAALNVNNPQELVDLSWTDNSSREVGFSIERASIFTDGAFLEIARVDTNEVSYQDSVRANVRYTYRVRALGPERNSIYSNLSTITSLPDDSLAQPAAPFNLDAQSVSEEQINLIWQYGTSSQVFFKIERSLTGDENDFSVLDTISNNLLSETKLYIDSLDLVRGRTYYYRVITLAERNSIPSNIDSAQAICNLQIIVRVSDASSSEVTICNGKATTLRVSSTIAGARYQWLKNDPSQAGIQFSPIAGATGRSFSATQEGAYRCQVSVGLGTACQRESINEVVVIVEELNDSVNIRQNEGILFSSLDDADEYQWYFNYQPIPGAEENRYEPQENGIYFLVIKEGTCSFTSNLLVFNVTSLESTNLSQYLKLNPNPAEDKALLKMDMPFRGDYKLYLKDLWGRTLKEWSDTKRDARVEQMLDISQLGSGMYILEFRSKFGQAFLRLMKQ